MRAKLSSFTRPIVAHGCAVHPGLRPGPARGAASRARHSRAPHRWLDRLCLLLLPLLLAAQETTINGRVIDAQTRQPLSGAAVKARLSEDTLLAESDAEGRFRIENAAPGVYSAWVLRSGYEPDLRLKFEVPVNAEETEVVVELERSAVVSGRVLDHLGRPVAGAKVTAYRSESSASSEEAIWVNLANRSSYAHTYWMGFTDDRGGYRLWGLREGEYVLAAAPPPEPGPPGLIRLRSATALYPNAPTFDEASRLELKWGEVREGVDIQLGAPANTRQTIRLANEGAPCDRCSVTVWRLGREADVTISDVRPSARGELILEGLPPGAYEVGAAARSGIGPGLTAIREFLVTADGDRPLSLTLSPPVSVQGRVVFEDPPEEIPKPPEEQARFPQFSVAAIGPLARETNKIFYSCRGEPALFFGEGKERFFDVTAAPGHCALRVKSPPDSYVAGVTLGGRPLEKAELTIPPEGLGQELAVRVRFDLGEVTGQVEDAQSDTYVFFLPVDSMPFETGRSAKVEADGSFRAKLPPGAWTVLATGSASPIMNNEIIARMRAPGSRRSRVEVKPNELTRLTAPLGRE